MPGPPANKGDKFIYEPSHGHGYGHAAKGQELTAEMTELDLKPGTEVTFLEYDQSDWPLVEWVDGVGIDRITAIEPDQFSSDFITA
jgi:plastocyanin